MPSPEHEVYLKNVKSWIQNHREAPDVIRGLEQHADVTSVLMALDLGPAKPVMERCYSERRRGSEPYDALAMLRMLVLSVLIGVTGINPLVRVLRGSRLLQVLAGFPVKSDGALRSPAVGTCYDFLHRLHDGPLRRLPGSDLPSQIEFKQSKTPRPPPTLVGEQEDKKEEASGDGKRNEGKKKKSLKKRGGKPVTAALRERLVEQLPQILPADLLTRLLEILDAVGVSPSAERGLLGDVRALVVAGDGSSLKTNADGHGKKVETCPHNKFERCDCERTYADPDACSGWDHYRECYFYGYYFYEIISVGGPAELPLFVSIAPANTHDQIAGMKAFSVLTRFHLGKDRGISIGILDKGHDGEPLSRFLFEDIGISTVIPISGDVPAVHPKRPDLKLASDDAIPLCAASQKMASWGTAGEGRPSFICPVKAGKLPKCPLAPNEEPGWLCEPDTKFGPTVTLNPHDNPRLFPAIARNSKKYKDLYNKRTACERSNAYKKGPGCLDDCRHRRQSFWLIRLYVIAIVQHARAWVAGADAKGLVAELLGRPAEPLAA